MIKIRYSDLPPGLHVRTAVQGRHTILYLLPGLTVAERRAALHRARSNARVGHGPNLPAAGVGVALAADRVRTTVRNTLAAVRIHPAFFVPAIIAIIVVAAIAVAYLLLASVSIRVRPPQTAGPGGQIAVPYSAVPGYFPTGAAAPGARPASPPAGGGSPDAASSGGAPRHDRGPRPTPGSRTDRSPSSSASPTPGGPGLSPGPSPGPSPKPSPGPPAPSPAPAPSPSGSGSGLCVEVGPLGLCLKV